ncbi:MAG: excinuclease ABC subunit C [Azospirillum brasilense]|nr:MAG: excinuclease ABC subunit C [Azospirillum brasilense]
MSFVNETVIPSPTPPELIGAEAIRAACKTIPGSPGVYRMLNTKGDVIYVGKAKNLTNRVGSYANLGNHNSRTLAMVNQVARVEVITTRNEAEALLQEAAQIKRFRPRYNILLKDDKSFPYLLLSDHAFPRMQKHRGAQSIAGQYFGPFASVGALNQTMALLQKIFLLRPCADTIFKNRTRPCLQYQIKRCSAPCVGYVTPEQYAGQIVRARDFMKGKHREVQAQLAEEMQRASDAMDFESAATLRDHIRALTQVQQETALRAAGLQDADVIALARTGKHSVVQVFFFRDGGPFGHQTFHPRAEADATDADVMEAFLGQFYQGHTPAPELLVNITPANAEVLEEALRLRAEAKVEIRTPQRGDKAELMQRITANAKAALAREQQQSAAVAEHLVSLQKLFALPYTPERIEVYDNSHIMGKQALGAMVVATPEGFEKRGYRTFNIKDLTLAPGDDYGMMREVFRRRFRQFRSKEGSAADAKLLVLVDGGAGQLSAVMGVMEELDLLDIPVISIAKGEDRNAGREWFHRTGNQPFQLPPNDATLHYIQRLRDEAHRFAIGTHRTKRSKSLTHSTLDDIPGIGATRKRALLQHFGSRAGVERATMAELQNVSGISTAVAKTIYDYFHG